MLGKRLINSNSAAAGGSCTTDTLQILGDTSCIAYYKMSDATDESGSYDGTATSVDFNVQGKFGNAGDFNGSSSGILLNNSPFTNTQSVSVCFWVKSVVAPTSSYDLIYQGDGNDYFYISVNTSGEIEVYPDNYLDPIYPRYNTLLATTNSNITDGGWHHIVVLNKIDTAANGGGYKIYVDGQLNASASFSSSLRRDAGVAQSSSIGVSNTGNSAYYDGKIDQVRIFNKALSQANVTTLYGEVDCACTTNTINYPTTNLAYYEFDGNAEDSTTNGYNGTDTAVTWAQGRYGTVGSFNGSSSYVDLGSTVDNPLRTAGEFGVSIWFNADSYGTNPVIFKLMNDTYIYVFLNGSNQLECRVLNSSGVESTITTPVSLNIWYHVVWTGDSTNGVTLYLNGSSVGNTSWNGTFLTYTNPSYEFNYLGYNGSNVGWYNGSIDQVRIFSSALSATDVTDLYDEQYCFDNFFNDDSTVATYKLNNTPFDDLGYYNGTAYNITYATGKFNKAAVFNGNSSYIDIDNIVPTNLNASLSIWVKSSEMNLNNTTVKTMFYNRNPYFIIYRYGGNWLFVIKNSSSSNYTVSYPVSNFNNNEWYHFAATCNGLSGTMNFYVNGVSVGTPLTAPPSILNAGSSGFIGSGAGGQYFNGSIDQVRIFDRAITSSEALQLYNE